MDSINIKGRDGFVFNDMLAASQLILQEIKERSTAALTIGCCPYSIVKKTCLYLILKNTIFLIFLNF